MKATGFDIETIEDTDAVWPELLALFLAFEEYNSGFLTRELRPGWEKRCMTQ